MPSNRCETLASAAHFVELLQYVVTAGAGHQFGKRVPISPGLHLALKQPGCAALWCEPVAHVQALQGEPLWLPGDAAGAVDPDMVEP